MENALSVTGEAIIERARMSDLVNVSVCCNALHRLEDGSELSVGASPQRAREFLADMLARDEGSVFVARRGGVFVGCIICQYDPALPDVALVGGLFTLFLAGWKTALRLMWAATQDAKERRCAKMYILAGTEKNRKRATYAALGFRLQGRKHNDCWVMKAALCKVEAGLTARMKGAVHGINH